MITLNNFEKYNYRDFGGLFLVAPGLVNSETTKNLTHLRSNIDSQVILMSFEADDDCDTFLELAIKLQKQGYQVIVEYNPWLFDQIKLRNINYIAIVPNPDIVDGLKLELEKIYNEVSDVYVKYYVDLTNIMKASKEIKDGTDRVLEMMTFKYQIKNAITEYNYMKYKFYRYI